MNRFLYLKQIMRRYNLMYILLYGCMIFVFINNLFHVPKTGIQFMHLFYSYEQYIMINISIIIFLLFIITMALIERTVNQNTNRLLLSMHKSRHSIFYTKLTLPWMVCILYMSIVYVYCFSTLKIFILPYFVFQLLSFLLLLISYSYYLIAIPDFCYQARRVNPMYMLSTYVFLLFMLFTKEWIIWIIPYVPFWISVAILSLYLLYKNFYKLFTYRVQQDYIVGFYIMPGFAILLLKQLYQANINILFDKLFAYFEKNDNHYWRNCAIFELWFKHNLILLIIFLLLCILLYKIWFLTLPLYILYSMYTYVRQRIYSKRLIMKFYHE